MNKLFTKIFVSGLLIIFLNKSASGQDGSIDISFGTDGHVLTTILEDKISASTNILIQKDGKILASGVYDSFGKKLITVVRYNLDGSLDNEFGESGIVKTYFAETQVEGLTTGLGLQSNGKIIISGYATSSTDYDLGIVRLLSSGKVDSSFGTNGRVLTQVGTTQDYAYAMVIQRDDKIILTGATHNSLLIDAFLVRYSSEGILDNSFGNEGMVITDFNGSVDDFRSITLQKDGKIICGGYSKNPTTIVNEFAVARYNVDGSLDTSFNEVGKMTIPNFYGFVNSIELLEDNKIMILGGTSGGLKPALAVINSDGTLDTNFGTNGLLETNFVNSTGDQPVKLLTQKDGKFIIIATTWSTGQMMSGQRFNNDGSVDETFGTDGAFFNDLNGQSFSKANSAIMAEDGSVYISGTTLTNKRKNIFSILKINNSSLPLTDIIVEKELAQEYVLSQNYPNPFNPSTKINFSIPSASNVTLKIFDLLGKEISELVSGNKSAGNYSVDFDASELSSGIYYYMLKAGNFSEGKKMMLVK